jgi:hypothetical protein
MMNYLFNKLGLYLGLKSTSHYPETDHKASYRNNLSYRIDHAFAAGFYDETDKTRSINWKLI